MVLVESLSYAIGNKGKNSVVSNRMAVFFDGLVQRNQLVVRSMYLLRCCH